MFVNTGVLKVHRCHNAKDYLNLQTKRIPVHVLLKKLSYMQLMCEINVTRDVKGSNHINSKKKRLVRKRKERTDRFFPNKGENEDSRLLVKWRDSRMYENEKKMNRFEIKILILYHFRI